MSWRVGVVGSGFGATVHVPAFRAQGRFDVVALASPTNARRIAAEREIPQAFASLGELLEAVEVDVVSVASPPFDHHKSVLAALARGKHVLCEKPFALNVAQAEEMLAAGERAGTVCAIAHEFRYTPSRLALHELIVNGHLGPLRDIEYTVLTSTLRGEHERANSWWFRAEHGGGIAGASLSHLIDTANWLAGRSPVRSVGMLRTANPERTHRGERFTIDVDDGAFALIDYGEGAIGRITTDATVAVDSAILSAHGEKRSAVASGKNILDATMFAIDDEELSELQLKEDPHANLASAHSNLPPFVNLLDEFAKALDGEPADLPTFADGVATQRVLQAVGYG
jgi:predicted dehydrogenase